MDGRREETSPFETSQMLSNFLASTPLLSNAWRQCHLANTGASAAGFSVDCVDDVAYVAFSGVVGAALELAGDTVAAGGNGLFSSLLDEEEGQALFQPGFLRLFSSMCSKSEFQSQILSAVNSQKAVVFTGHSIGGAIASLSTLWLLSSFTHLPSTCSLLCITFGSPLLGNEALSRIVLRQQWGNKFCHVVSKHDIMPRLLFAPLCSVSAQLSSLLKYWQFHMRFIQQFQKPTISLPEQEIVELRRFISTYTSAAATATEKENIAFQSSYKPFGTYLFCSKECAICISKPTAILRLLHLTFMSSSMNSGIEDHLTYGETVPRISNQFLKKRHISKGGHNSSYEAGIDMALEALGMQSQDPLAGVAGTCLMMARQVGRPTNLNSADLAIRLAKVTPCRAQIEWYKVYCDNCLGYYDSFKLKRPSKRESQVDINRRKLALFWDNVIEMIQMNQLPHNFHRREKWVYASHSYKLLVEPLEIAEYYRTGKHRTQGHYLARGREKRFHVFDKWWQERPFAEDKEGSSNKTRRTQFAGLTQDSCFWARVEEARDWANQAWREANINELVELWENMNKFDRYATELVEKKEVSRDVLAKDSSYDLWVEEWRKLKPHLEIRVSPQLEFYLEKMVCDLPAK